MTLRERGEAHLVAGEYQQAIPLLLRSITTDRQDAFKYNATVAASALMLIDEFAFAEDVLHKAEATSFATASIHRHMLGLTCWFRGELSPAVAWFWKAGKAGYQNLGWRMCLHYASIRQPQLVSRTEIRDCFQPKLDKLKRTSGLRCDNELKLAFALQEISRSEFEQEMRVVGERYRRKVELEMQCELWVALDCFLNHDEKGGEQRLLNASRPRPGLDSWTDEMALARLELQRLGIDPMTGRSLRRPVVHSAPVREILEQRAEAKRKAIASAAKKFLAIQRQASKMSSAKGRSQRAGTKRQDRSVDGSQIGGFLNLVAIAGTPRRVDAALNKVTARRSVKLTTPGRDIPEESSLIQASVDGRTCLVLPPGVTDIEGFSRDLSKAVRGPVLWCHIHDGDFWTYVLFDSGTEIDRFVPLPRYWGPQSREDLAKVKGNALQFAGHWPDVSAGRIKPYLRFWDQMRSNGRKAHPDDGFGYGDCRQLVDFLRALKLWIPRLSASPEGVKEAEWQWSTGKPGARGSSSSKR